MPKGQVGQLAHNLVNYSCEVGPGDKVLIENTGIEPALVTALVKEVHRVKGIPFVSLKDARVERSLLIGASEEQIKLAAKYAAFRMQEMDAYIGVRSGSNMAELSDVPAEKMELFMRFYTQEVHAKIRVAKTRWVVLRYPNPSMAQAANMSTEAFIDLYFQVCNLDYQKMSQAMEALVQGLEATDKVRIVGPGTELSFSLQGMPAIKCDGKRNIPDGEVYTAPVRDSVNGHITYNTPSVYQGVTYENIRFEFQQGKIIKATANDTMRLNKVLDTDAGARYIGEFALGVNPYLERPINDILFDEKIAGSFHFTPGNAYDECPNGNKSAIHWDLVSIQTPAYGGGEIYFDDKLIRKDGHFVVPELKGLNPEHLK